MTFAIRPFRSGDTDGVVATVREVFAEYGFTFEDDGYCSDLFDIEGSYLADGGRFWCVESDGEIVGCAGLELHGLFPGEPGTVTLVEGHPRVAGTDAELVRLYVRPMARGQRLGERLTLTVCDAARAQGRTAVEVWSDKKLTHAHALYQRLGARLVGDRVCPGDPDQSLEWGFLLPLD